MAPSCSCLRKGRAHVKPGGNRKAGKNAKGKPRSRWVKWLGTCDQIVEHFKPKQRPRWMTPEAYAALPDVLQVRELRYRVAQRGYRVKEVVLATTLLNAQVYASAELSKLYQQRWEIETNLRHLKHTLHMDVLRTKSVDGIHKELAMFVIAYNLVRLVMLQSSRSQNVPVIRISFVDALRRLRHADGSSPRRKLNELPERPNRFEPRVKKRRAKSYPLMRKPRKQLQQDLITKQLKA